MTESKLSFEGRGVGRKTHMRSHQSVGQITSELTNTDRELLQLSVLGHQSLPMYVRKVQDEYGPRYVRNKVPGVSLSKYLQMHGRLDEYQALLLARTISNALSHLHSHSMCAMTLLPSTVYIKEDWTVCLVDFGVREIADAYSSDINSATTWAFCGPENLKSKTTEYDQSLDIFKLGMLLLVALLGRLPWKIHNIVSISNDILKGLIPIPGDINPEIRHLLKDMLQVDNSARPSIMEVETRINTIVHRLRSLTDDEPHHPIDHSVQVIPSLQDIGEQGSNFLTALGGKPRKIARRRTL